MEMEFAKLVKELGEDALAGLRQAVVAEMGERRQKTAIRIEDIHPGMTDADRARVREEIARVLRGEE